VEGQNILIEARFADGDSSLMPALAAELVHLPVDLIVAGVTAVEVVKDATSTIPIVMVYPTDPVAGGLIASLARPGGNITGLTYFAGQLADKRLELLRDTVPSLTRIAVLQEAHLTNLAHESARLDRAARALGIQVQWLEVSEPDELSGAFEAIRHGGSEALIVGGSTWFVAHRSRQVGLAQEYQVPATYFHLAFVQAGGLMSYAVNLDAQFRRAAYYVDRILKGARPADLPVEQPMRFEFVINARTAQALGLTIPQHVLLQATEVLQ
jgi:putative ABC transport system substrate-binding protein